MDNGKQIRHGYIKCLYPDRGYGFIRCGYEDVFFHVTDTPWRDPEFNDRLLELEVQFVLTIDKQRGKTKAVEVRPAR